MNERAVWVRTRLRMLLFSLYYGSSGERMGVMKKFLVLARVQLRALLSSLRVGGSRKRAASVWAALLLAAVLCVCMSGSYSFALGGQLSGTGALHLVLVLMPAQAVIAGVVFTAFAAQGVVFGGRDADLLLSMPVPAVAVLGSKLTALYAENLVFCLFLVLPAGAAWLWYGGGGGALFVLRLVIGVLFLALLPTVLSLAAGALLSLLGGRFANRRAVNLLLYVLLMAAVFAAVLGINRSVSQLMAGALGVELEGAFSSLWGLPFLWFQRGVCGAWGTLGQFCLAALVPMLLAAAVCARFYQPILTGLRSHSRRAAYRVDRLRAAGCRRALLRKEASRFFGTPIYLFNAGFGLLVLAGGGVAAGVMGPRLRALLAQAEGLPLLSLSAAAVAFTLSTVAVTASSVSLEGRNLWILREAPVSVGQILDVKAGFQLLLTAPCLLLGVLGVSWGLGLSAAEGAALLVSGLAFGTFTALLGLAANLLLPKLDAVNDMVVVKQSAASIAGVLGGMAAALLCALLVWLLTGPLGELGALCACGLLLLLASGGLYRWLHTGGVARFEAL